MPRRARVVIPGAPHHITQRGIRRSNIFQKPVDRDRYIEFFHEASRRHGLNVCAYCLMTNHVHFVAVPDKANSLWMTFHHAHTKYAVMFNQQYELSGHLFQGRPYSSPLDEQHFWTAIRYVECNPVRAGMVEQAELYPWSSAAVHCGLREDSLVDLSRSAGMSSVEWSRWLAIRPSEEECRRIRERTFNGKPCGSEDFTREIELQLGLSFTPQKPGPKPRSGKDHPIGLPSGGQ